MTGYRFTFNFGVDNYKLSNAEVVIRAAQCNEG